jgi:hypothetical protein
MPSLNWADVVEIAHDDAKQTILSMLDTAGFAATSWQEGDAGLATVEVVAEVWAQLSSVAVYLKGAFLNSTASGEALTKLSDSHYDNQRVAAVAAQRRITLSCASTAGPHTFDVGDLVLAHADGDTYRNIDDGVTVYPVTLASGGSVADLIFEAEIAGAQANKAPNTVTILQTTLAGVTVASDAREQNGINEEADPTLQTRNTTKWALLTRFELIKDAVINIALTAGGPDGVTAAEVDDQNPRGAGTFDVYLAGDLATASAGAVSDVQDALDALVFGSGATPKTCIAYQSPPATLSFAGTIYYKGSYSPAEMADATQTALDEFIKIIPLGGFDFSPGPSNVVPINDVEDMLKSVKVSDQAVQKTVVLTSPADLFVAPFSKVVQGTVTLTFTRVTG